MINELITAGRLVIITVSGGVADVASCPDDVEVEIKDYDHCTCCDDDSQFVSDHCADYCTEED